MKKLNKEIREELKNWTVYGMIEGEQTFMQALIEASAYLELDGVSFDGHFQAECVASYNEWVKNN